MKKRAYISPETTIIPIIHESHLLSTSPGHKDTDQDPYDGPWDGKEETFEEDDYNGWGDNAFDNPGGQDILYF